MRIELIQPHTHVGKSLSPGDTPDLADDLAAWLIAEGVAKALSAERPSRHSTQSPKEEKFP